MKINIIFFIILFWNLSSFSQVNLNLDKKNGVYKVPCKVNGIPMKFIFDTGATNVSISITEASFLLKQGLLDKTDILSSANYEIANGNIIEGTKIILKTIEINDIKIENIEATVVHSQNAPLLLGMSAINKLGKVSISNNELIIGNSKTTEEKREDIVETINWINNKIFENSSNGVVKDKKYYIDKIITQNSNDIYLILIETNSEEQIVYKIPLKKISPITFKKLEDYIYGGEYYALEIRSKNNDFSIQSSSSSGLKEDMIYVNLYLNSSIDNDNLTTRLKKAFSFLMIAYGNDGKEKF